MSVCHLSLDLVLLAWSPSTSNPSRSEHFSRSSLPNNVHVGKPHAPQNAAVESPSERTWSTRSVVLVAAVDLAEEEQGADDVGAPDVHHWPPPFQVHLPPCPDTSWASVTCWTTQSSSPGPSKGCSSPTVQFMAHRLFGCWGLQRITSEVLVVEKCVRASVDRFNWVSSEI